MNLSETVPEITKTANRCLMRYLQSYIFSIHTCHALDNYIHYITSPSSVLQKRETHKVYVIFLSLPMISAQMVKGVGRIINLHSKIKMQLAH